MKTRKEIKELVENLYNTYDMLNEETCIKTGNFFYDIESWEVINGVPEEGLGIKYEDGVTSKDLDMFYDFEESIVDKVAGKERYNTYTVLNIVTDSEDEYMYVNIRVEDIENVIIFKTLEDVLDLKYKVVEEV